MRHGSRGVFPQWRTEVAVRQSRALLTLAVSTWVKQPKIKNEVLFVFYGRDDFLSDSDTVG